jgi:pimeloyl-ACP methyl ester carboxylesterase
VRKAWNACLAALLLLTPNAAAAGEARTGMVETAPGIRLHYEKIGDGPQLVIVPGGFLHDSGIRSLARPGRTLILYDMRNRGASSRVERDDQISIEADVADLKAIHDRFGAGKTSLIGYSYLGLMTVLYALDRPDKVERIVQIGPVPIKFGTELPADLIWRDPAPVIPEAQIEEIRALRDEGFDRAHPREYCLRYERLMRLRLVADPAHAERIDPEARCALENEWPVNIQRHLALHFEGSVQKLDPPRDMIAALDVPVLTLHGTMDRNAPFAAGVEWASTLPNARLIAATGAAHQLWLDREQAIAEIDTFLAGAWPESAVKVKGWDDARRLLPAGLGPPR